MGLKVLGVCSWKGYIGESLIHVLAIKSRSNAELMISISLNGKTKSLKNKNLSLSKLINELDINPSHIIVDQNGTLYKGSALENTFIKDGDKIEVIHFMGGGQAKFKAENLRIA